LPSIVRRWSGSLSSLASPPPVTERNGFFITGTDTCVGKSEVTAALAALIAHKGGSVFPRKPIESGCQPNHQGERLFPADGYMLQQASQTADSLETVTPYRFEPALSPELAARNSGTTITLQQLVTACETPMATEQDRVLVEGAGGFYSPIAEQALNADLAVALGLPVILVAEDRLGAINQTLLARHAILSHGLTLAAIILQQQQQQQPDNGNLASIQKMVTELVIPLPFTVCGSAPWMELRKQLEPTFSALYR